MWEYVEIIGSIGAINRTIGGFRRTFVSLEARFEAGMKHSTNTVERGEQA